MIEIKDVTKILRTTKRSYKMFPLKLWKGNYSACLVQTGPGKVH